MAQAPSTLATISRGHEFMRIRLVDDAILSGMIDVHALEFLRVNAPLANLPEFYRAFGVKPGDAMWRADSVRVAIW
jgi:predicted metalloendopeptidase